MKQMRRIWNWQNCHHLIQQSYGNIKKSNNSNWGMFLFDKNELVGVCEVMYEEEKGIPILLIVFMFIDDQYRKKKPILRIIKKNNITK